METVTTALENKNSMAFPQLVNVDLTYNPTSLLIITYSDANKGSYRSLYVMFTVVSKGSCRSLYVMFTVVSRGPYGSLYVMVTVVLFMTEE